MPAEAQLLLRSGAGLPSPSCSTHGCCLYPIPLRRGQGAELLVEGPAQASLLKELTHHAYPGQLWESL